MSLTEKQINILRLVQRSTPGENGWYEVSKVVWPLVNGTMPADLVETQATDDGGNLRFTIRGQAVADYL
jgi:hypothetical protein